MPAYKNKESGTWYVVTQYTDWTGARKQKCKRGFDTRREALEWEQKFQQQSAGDLDMSFEALAATGSQRSSHPHRKIRRFGDGWQRGFSKSSLPVGGGIEANSIAERLSGTPRFEDVGSTHKPRKTAEASAEAAYPLGERNALLMAPLSKVLLRYFWQK